MATPKMSPEIFWSKVEKTEGCWYWHGTIHHSGYGVVYYQNRQWRAHRLTWLFTTGEVPPTNLRHTCDNRLCCRPDHLLVGTPAQNSADMVQRGRQARGKRITANRNTAYGERNGAYTHPGSIRKGEQHWKARLTWPIVDDMRERYAIGLVTISDLHSERPSVSRSQIARILRGEAWIRPGETVPNLGKGRIRGPDGRMQRR